METFVKSFFQSLGEVPEKNIPPEYHTPLYIRGILFGNYAYPTGLLAHALFLVVFALIGVRMLAYFNILSVILFATAYIFHRRGYLWTAYYLITIEIITHAALCTAIIGWDTGFQYYVFIQPAVVFLIPGKMSVKIITTAIHTCAFAAMNYYANISVPQLGLSTLHISLFNYGNIFAVCSLLAYLVYQYYRAANIAEKKLEKEYKKTNAALNERNQILNQLNRELKEASDYVRTILPLPITEGTIQADWRFIPCASLGGDAFGFHWLDDDHFAMYLIDVSGHGVGAALLSISVINVLRSQSLPDTDFKKPDHVLESLNSTFPGEENNDMFFTIWYGVYNSNTRELTYASGGHPPAILLDTNSKGDAIISLLRTPNYVVGGIPEVNYQKKEYQIAENSTLYIFSDGVYEIEKSDGSMWKFEEFAEFMSEAKKDGQSRLDCLYRYARKIGESSNFEDDFTVVEVAFG